MGQLADAIATVNAREIDANETAIASSFAPPPQLSPEAHERLAPFLRWCELQRVRALPARPACVAAYVRWQQDNGIARQRVAESLEAIAALHESVAVGNPCATAIVRTVTGGSTIEAPRSWSKDSKVAFAELPVEIQAVIAKREHERERELRRMQNELADLKKRQQQSDADNKVLIKSEETKTMAKRPKGVGPYAGMDKDSTVRHDSSDLGYHPPQDIWDKVEKAHTVHPEGFAAKLPRNVK